MAERVIALGINKGRHVDHDAEYEPAVSRSPLSWHYLGRVHYRSENSAFLFAAANPRGVRTWTRRGALLLINPYIDLVPKLAATVNALFVSLKQPNSKKMISRRRKARRSAWFLGLFRVQLGM